MTRLAHAPSAAGVVAFLALTVSATTACTSPSDWFGNGGRSQPPVDTGDPERADGVADGIDPSSDPMGMVTVRRVIDGDSLEVEHDGQELDVRLLGFNAPELYRESVDGSEVESCQGAAAREALDSLAPSGSRVLLVIDDRADSDRFGRTLADLAVGAEPGGDPGTPSVVAAMVDQGWGFATGDRLDHRELMKRAAEDRQGMWGDGCGRPSVTTVKLGRVQADAPGDDRFNLTEEWVEIVNTGSADVDLTGWMIRDDTTGHRFVLDRAVPADRRLLIRTGSGSDDAATVHLDQSFPVWSNERETVVLIDDNGVFVDWRFLDS